MKGGKRPGAGRKKGVPNRATTKRMEQIKAGGEMPLDVMLAHMRNPKNPDDVRRAMAVAAAPYCHPRLASVEAKHSGSLLLTHEQALDELD